LTQGISHRFVWAVFKMHYKSFVQVAVLAGALLGLASAAASGKEQAFDWWRRLDVRDLSSQPVLPNGRWVVIGFLSPECPVANAYIPVLNQLAEEFGSRGVSFVGAYVDPAATLDVLRRHSADYLIHFPVADDRAQRLVQATGARFTPEVFVYAADGSLLYRGRIDDRMMDFGAARAKPSHQELHDVLTQLLAGNRGPFENKRGFGCAIPEPVKR
jgi:thiol-disulfide isomerase/thioredoxin